MPRKPLTFYAREKDKDQYCKWCNEEFDDSPLEYFCSRKCLAEYNKAKKEGYIT